jgi:hypothetical protein
MASNVLEKLNSSKKNIEYHRPTLSKEELQTVLDCLVDDLMDTGSVVEKFEKILLGPFSKTHAERDEFVFSDFTGDKAVVLNHRLKPGSYAQLSSTFRYIAAPRGNGLDTHRFWESLYRGGIPVVKKSVWSTQIQALGIPLLEVNSWDAREVLETVSSAEKFMAVRPELPQLWLSWWEQLIRKEI